MEIWLHGFPVPRHAAALAVEAEERGFDGLMLADSENLVGDPYVELALAARDTTRLRLGVAVTNPVTRHPAVTASAIATLQIESDGRAVLVLGRGDSAVLQLGIRPATTAQLERAVGDIRAFLRGDDVPTATGASARMAWIAPFAPAEVPVSVAATGPGTVLSGATAVVERLGTAYQEAQHGLRTASHSAVLPDEFLDRFTVVGPADHCAERLRELADLGLDRIIMVPASRDADPELVAASNRLFAEEVIPRLRG